MISKGKGKKKKNISRACFLVFELITELQTRNQSESDVYAVSWEKISKTCMKIKVFSVTNTKDLKRNSWDIR